MDTYLLFWELPMGIFTTLGGFWFFLFKKNGDSQNSENGDEQF
jgi:hypothetical protein